MQNFTKSWVIFMHVHYVPSKLSSRVLSEASYLLVWPPPSYREHVISWLWGNYTWATLWRWTDGAGGVKPAPTWLTARKFTSGNTEENFSHKIFQVKIRWNMSGQELWPASDWYFWEHHCCYLSKMYSNCQSWCVWTCSWWHCSVLLCLNGFHSNKRGS